MFNHLLLIPWGSFRGRKEEKWGSFWGRDHFGVDLGIISGFTIFSGSGSFRGLHSTPFVLPDHTPDLRPIIISGVKMLNFIKPRSRRLGGFLLRLRFILFFFRFVGNYIQTSADDVPLGQLSSPDDVIISQL